MHKLRKGLSSLGKVEEQVRFLSEENFDLGEFLEFKIQRGSEESASLEYLGFKVQTAGLENDVLEFDLIFDDPLQVSIGKTQDILVTTIIDVSFFSKQNDGVELDLKT